MKFRGNTPEAAGYRAAAANAGLAVFRGVAGAATGNLGFIADIGHDASDVVSLGAKARAMETGTKTSQRLRLGAAGLFLAGGLFGVGSGIYASVSEHQEDASPVAVGAAFAAAGASIELARRTHKQVNGHDFDDESEHHAHAAHDTIVHLGSDALSSTLYASGLAGQLLTGSEAWGNGGLLASGTISTIFAVQTLRTMAEIKKHPRNS